jgi:hypothetical protein
VDGRGWPPFVDDGLGGRVTAPLALDPVIAAHIAAINSFDVDAVGDHVTTEPVEAVDNAGMWCVRCRYDGDYDKTGLPDPLIMTNYFRVRDGKIVTLFIIKNTAPQY